MHYILKNKNKIFFEDCTAFLERFFGFMLKIEPIKYGKRFPKCNSIHTFFCFQQMDIILTDKENRIIKMYPSFKSERIIFPKRNVYYVYELPLNSCKLFSVGDILRIKESN